MAFTSLAGALTLVGALGSFQSAMAQDAETPVAEEEAPMTPEEKQKAAIALFGEGQKLLTEASYAEAVAKFEEAFELFPDPGLKVKVGEAYQRDGTEQRDYDKLRKAVEAYQKYVELVPEGEITTKILERINQLEESIQAEQERIERVADEATQAKLDDKLAREAEEEAILAKEQEKKSMQKVLLGGILAGADQQLSGILRFSGGGMLSWEKFALEARVGIDGFLRVDKEQGVQARSFTLIDIGARYGTQYRYIGPFVSGGASFGLFSGSPRERTLVSDDDSCGGGDCSFDMDKNISTRLAFGYGFEATDKSTVALRIEAQTWFFSVDSEQSIGNPNANDISKPQTAVAIMVGLEFMRWL
ncbi:MAG: hypothetical protein GY811_08150 [Myxococcales bacterium]|nr:hypothetical protein [Myxococcales bacterium]